MEGIYCGEPPLPADLWTSWNFDPAVIAALMVVTYFVRSKPSGLAAVAVMIVAFISPLCAFSSALFSARVVHHILLIAVAAPLLALAFPAKRTSSLAWPFAVSSIVLWGWHVPQAYDLALSNIAVYWVMQLSLLGTGLWFWRSVFAANDAPAERIVYIIVSFAQMGMLGAILTFAPSQLYAIHAIAPYEWGFTPLGDQQLGGLIMWVPAGVPYAVIAVLLARRSWARFAGVAA